MMIVEKGVDMEGGPSTTVTADLEVRVEIRCVGDLAIAKKVAQPINHREIPVFIQVMPDSEIGDLFMREEDIQGLHLEIIGIKVIEEEEVDLRALIDTV